jgi:nucleotide-binding universal stress UspA family protein
MVEVKPRFRRILVAYDGSARAQDALVLAQRLRDPDWGVLTLACVVTDRWHFPRRPRPPADPLQESVAGLLEEGRAQVAPGVPVRLRSPVASSAARGLTEIAEAEGADLVVVGSSRRGQAGRVALERTSGRLLQGAPCAVAVAPAELRDPDPFRHVGIAYDGSPESDAALHAGYAIAAANGAAVSLFHAFVAGSAWDAAPDENVERKARLHAQELLDNAADSAPHGVNPRTVLLFGAPEHVIADACDGIVDLLALGSRGYGPVQRALLGSVSERLVDGAGQPVLVMPRHPVRVGDEDPLPATPSAVPAEG